MDRARQCPNGETPNGHASDLPPCRKHGLTLTTQRIDPSQEQAARAHGMLVAAGGAWQARRP